MTLTDFYTRYGIAKRTFYDRVKRQGIDMTAIRDDAGQLTPEGIDQLLTVVTDKERVRAEACSDRAAVRSTTDDACGESTGTMHIASEAAQAPRNPSEAAQVYLLTAEVERLQRQLEALRGDLEALRAERNEYYQMYRTERDHSRELERQVAVYMERQQTSVERLEALLASAIARPAIAAPLTENAPQGDLEAVETQQGATPAPRSDAIEAAPKRRRWSILSWFRK